MRNRTAFAAIFISVSIAMTCGSRCCRFSALSLEHHFGANRAFARIFEGVDLFASAAYSRMRGGCIAVAEAP